MLSKKLIVYLILENHKLTKKEKLINILFQPYFYLILWMSSYFESGISKDKLILPHLILGIVLESFAIIVSILAIIYLTNEIFIEATSIEQGTHRAQVIRRIGEIEEAE